MATPNVGILTNAGKNLIDRVNAGQTKISFSKIVFSSMNNNQLTDDQIKALTTVAPQEVVVNNPKVTLDNNTGETRIRATGNNKALNDGVYVKTYAVYAKDDSGNEILYGITVSPNPNYLPEYDGVTPQAVTYSYKVNISNTSKITFTNSNDIYVSDTDLAEALQPYAKTVDVNQQLDKKVNVADMRKPASDVAGIEEVNVKQDKIGYTPADDSKVVHTADMRKPASDVAGIEEVNAKQDKIGYTPADDSKVVHDNHDNTITANNLTYDLSKSGLTSISFYNSGSFNDLPLGTVFAGSAMADGPDKTHTFITTTFYFSGWSGRKAQIAIADSGNLMYFRVYMGIKWESWTLLSDDSKVVHSTDMRKPASDVAGIEEVNAKQDKIGYTPADDSKVVHKSGANNFNTVPTVNNNPLLLASSLPSDLARTGSNQEFTGKNTFDTAPIDKTTGHPYITKDGVPSDVARTGQAQTFTAAQTFSIAPTIKDASQDKGDTQAATMADLKSVENSAWRPVKLSSDAQNMKFSTAFYQKNDNTKKFTLIVMGDPEGTKSVFSTPKLFFTDPDIKAFIGSVSVAAGEFNNGHGLANSLSIDLTIKGNSLMFTTEFWVDRVTDDTTSFLSNHPYAILAWSGYQIITGKYK
ncbi:hypothetical protein QUF07_02360 [Lentilactobacillus sp. TOM.63]|uniref:hypothetical protein n=1 Tax=Lentilactobacillus sp. TOM.63 TaxID=3055077 RepID=UPI0025A115A5|nr:hypothetical protein [Lentilactobacillus sp. TOM.63]MDM7515548.1 hypothetical protein [Lentilactobacillus sp. TOM.63]